MSNVSKRRREGSRTKIKTMGDHKEFLNRITKTLYYGHLPTLPCLSLPVTEISCSVWSETQRGRSLRRLHADAAARVARGACVSPCALVLALLYLERLNACSPDYLLHTAPQDLFLISLMVGNKFLQDDGEDDEVISSEWAASGDLDIKQLNKLELEFLDAINWNIFVNEESFEAGLSRLERRVALKQAKARGFFTYTDLTMACDTAFAAELMRALTSACLTLTAGCAAGIATLLTSALVVSHAWLPALRLIASRSTDLSALDPFPPPSYKSSPQTFLNNATVEFTIDALADQLEATERLECCADWAARARRPGRNIPSPARSPGAPPRLSWRALGSPVRRWLERLAEYAELTRTALIGAASSPDDDYGRCDDFVGRKPKSPHNCVHQWLNLSKLSALLVTVSDR